jgi:hypothetical protein
MSVTKLMPVKILEWKPFRKNSLLGFVAIQLGALKIKDITVNLSNERRWCGLPAKPMIDNSGAAVRTDQGKIRYVPILEWETKGAHDRFSESVLAALEEAYPDSTLG